MSKILPKMSVKTLGANPKKAAAGDNLRIPLIRVLGVASGIKAATDARGDPVFGLTGQFEGTNIETGETAQSGVLYLPGGIQELLQGPLETAIADDKNARIQFAYDIFAVSASNPAGYSFEAENLIEVEREDPFAAMRAELATKSLPKLPAPAKAK